MYWTLELASYLSDAPWPANKDELIDYAIRAGAPLVENLQSIEDEGEIYESMEEIWPDYPTDEDYLGTRTNIKKTQEKRSLKENFFLLNYTIFRNKNIL
jgi:hypothetical protein